jgi:hypothetical protein
VLLLALTGNALESAVPECLANYSFFKLTLFEDFYLESSSSKLSMFIAVRNVPSLAAPGIGCSGPLALYSI